MQVGGTTLTSAPVSTRQQQPEERSFVWNRRQLDGPAALVAASAWPSHLKNESRENDSDMLGHHTSGGTNRMYQKVKLPREGPVAGLDDLELAEPEGP